LKKAVFISHSTQDKTIAGMVCQALEQERIPCWIAPRDVPYGENAFEAIPLGVAEATVLVLILSANANSSKYVQRELQLALDYKKLIVPFRIEDIRPEGAVNFMLTGVQWLDAFVPPVERHVAALVERIVAIVDVEQARAVEELQPVSKAPAKSASKVPWAWAGAGVAALLVAVGAGWKVTHPALDDAAIQREVAQRLQTALAGQGVAVDCTGCVPPQAFANVQVVQGAVTVMGSGPAQAGEAVRGVPLGGLQGVRSVSYAFNVAAGVGTAVKDARVAPAVAAVPIGKASVIAPVAAGGVASVTMTPEQLRAKAYVMKGQQLMGEQNYESAANNFEQALNLEPGNAGAKSGLRAAKKALGEPE
jgi:hypothetical protein